MKRHTILLLLSVLLLSGGAAAQSTKEQTLEDLNRTAALYYCYENHPRAAATPAPEGYEPFYISHYGRHGSRWHASESVYENPRAKLRKAAEAGKLTPLGEEALRRIEVVADDARHRYANTAASPYGCTAPSPKSFRRRTAACAASAPVRRSCRAACSAWPPQTNGSKS